MKYFNLCFFIVMTSAALAQTKAAIDKAINIWETAHFKINYKQGQTTQKEAEIIGEKAEVFFKRLESYLDHKLQHKLIISLEGNRGDDPKHRWAYVDDVAGWIHLFRFPEDTFSYQTGLSHELVHAYRFEHLSKIELPPAPAFVFLEEGIAEYLSNLIEPKKETFANFGYDLEVTTGQWIESNEDIPLETLLRDQYRLRPLCIPQAYTLQASFIQYIGQELGSGMIRRLAYAKDIRDEKSFIPYLKDSFSTWTSKWRSSLLAQFKKIPNHVELGHNWRSKTSVAGMHICKKGTDF